MPTRSSDGQAFGESPSGDKPRHGENKLCDDYTWPLTSHLHSTSYFNVEAFVLKKRCEQNRQPFPTRP
jgi:hypothetical protein